MTLLTTDSFIATAAAGTDWRDTARAVLESLESARTPDDGMNIGFIYISDHLADDSESIAALFQSVTGIKHWVGGVGLGVLTSGQDYFDRPAISAMIGRLPPESFAMLPMVDLNASAAAPQLEPWLDRNETVLGLVHGDPKMDADPAHILAELERMTGAFIVGGLCSSRKHCPVIGEEVGKGGLSGVLFSSSVPVATVLSQGCAPLGITHTITRCDDHKVMELDGRRAYDVFMDDLKTLAKDPKHPAPLSTDDPEQLFDRHIHVAFPIQGSDQRDYMVRNAVAIDTDDGSITVAHPVQNGEQMMFVHRNDETVKADLSRTLLELRDRVQRERGTFSPKGAVYISCVTRAASDFGAGSNGEMSLVREILGDLPLVGFYANGEISNRRLYGYTAVVILFV